MLCADVVEPELPKCEGAFRVHEPLWIMPFRTSARFARDRAVAGGEQCSWFGGSQAL